MPSSKMHKPRDIPQVMVSSTYTDLKDHRKALIDAINAHDLHPNVMEHDSAKLSDVIDSSIQMVRDSAAYILIISQKYGQTPECKDRNPKKRSITELEFDEALRLGRPTLLFVMGDDHDIKSRDIELDPEKRAKLEAFRKRAKKNSPESDVDRVYAVFNSQQHFKDQMNSPLAELRDHLNSVDDEIEDESPPSATAPAEVTSPESGERVPKAIPTPPDFYAEPDYIGSHDFVGRESQLQDLDDWANAADPTNLLLFECIGGNGKSMLTWEWTTNPNHASALRDWAGVFWYSFYERGAVMADFCRRALAYMTQTPLKGLEKKNTPDLAEDLLAQLHAQPWLLILDGLERVLVAYHRIDAAEVPDEEVNAPTDKVLDRNPCDTIRDEDGILLRSLAGAKPSKILVSSRLTPRVLLNPASQLIPGAKRIALPGLRPADAEKLLRSCDIEGDSAAIREYLAENCDNHPLVIGVLAGLIANYLPKRGNFDAWLADPGPQGGARLDLASLDLTQRRNHILRAAIDDLSEKSHQLLSTLALLSDSVDYDTLEAFNPHMPPEPEEVVTPSPPEKTWRWKRISQEGRAYAKKEYESALVLRKEYEQTVMSWRESAEVREAPGKLVETVRDLEQRGLLQYDGRTRRHDLHPVVRGVATGDMRTEDKERLGQRVVDHFSSMPHDPYQNAKTLEDVAPGLQVVRTLLKLGQYEEASSAFRGELVNALLFNLEAHFETLSLLRPFFTSSWSELPKRIDFFDAEYLANQAGYALDCCGNHREAVLAFVAGLQVNLKLENWTAASTSLHNTAQSLITMNTASALHVANFSLDISTALGDQEGVFTGRLGLFKIQIFLGLWEAAESNWQVLNPMGRDWPRYAYRQGTAEHLFARAMFSKGTLRKEHILDAAALAEKDNNRSTLRELHQLRGVWRLEQEDWEQAAASFHEAVRMARERRLVDEESEAGLALAKFHLGQLGPPDDARQEAERLARQRSPHHHYLAMLWRELSDLEEAKKHALLAYRWAWADGEPYVHRYELTKSSELLQELNAPIPDLPPYDPDKDERFPWEADVRAAIEKLRAERAAEPEETD